jgi:tripeptidyl-peptidase-1
LQVKGYMAPSDESVSLVQEWLLAHGIVSKGLIGHGDWLGFSTTVGKASELFGAKFLNVKHLATGKEEVRTLSYSIPENLRSHIELAYPMIS